MKRALKIAAIVLGGVVALVLAIGVFLYNLPADPFAPVYAENCAVCHGEALEGAAQGPALVSRTLASGDAVPQLVASIGQGFPERGMPGWAGTLSESQVRGLAILIAERRAHREMTDFKVDKPLAIPTGAVDSELVRFRIETVASGIDPKPFSIAPLPDGSLLVTEKTKGIRIVSPDGTLSAPIIGTPETSGFGVTVRGLDYRIGALLDVAPHPDYARNGWIYLVHTDLCAECRNGGKLVPTTMNRLVRGRIAGGRWVDEEVIWSVPQAFYTPTPDLAAGGRLAFSRDGHVFVSVGIKGAGEQFGIQDLATPYGKIHRVRDDGRIPEDNPFVARAGAMPSIWTYGHRSPQGLELDPQTGELWGTEMGQRGGDEVNHLRPGRNYGWPLTSRGLKYDGTPVDYGKELGITLDLRTIEQPVVDLTPSPAVSSFVIYQGAEFPEWQGNFIVGSLKATELYRFVIDGDQLVHSETLLTDLARIRDVAVGPHGELYLLLEHASGARIVRLVPVRGA
ncbi:MAG TPA: PQQ-dependent sugar dehydrogenase [Myxococcota bacterium]|jgi:glucose/arabinose dehydrogenase